MKKEGQLTSFIILGLIVVGTAILLLYSINSSVSIKTGKELEKIETSQSKLAPISNYVQGCLEKTGREGLYETYLQGGYYLLPANISVNYGAHYAPYYYLNKSSLVPEIETVENELSVYVKNEIGNCINLTNFRNAGFDVLEGNKTVSALISKNGVELSMKYPIVVMDSKAAQGIENFKASFHSDAWALHDTAKKIIGNYNNTMHSDYAGAVCMTCLEEISKNSSVEIKAAPVFDPSADQNNIIWFFIYGNPDSNGERLMLRFVVESKE